MEYLMINESKLKVTLEAEELEYLAPDVRELDYGDPAAKKLFGDILVYAKDRFGFDTEGYRVLLQLYPSKDGSCELFITRLGRLEGADCKGENTPPKKESKENKEIKREKKKRREKAYRFDKLSYLLAVCKRLSDGNSLFSSSAYVDGNGAWYLLLSFEEEEYEDVSDVLPIGELSFISEYASSENPRSTSLYLCEYGKTVCASHAIETLGSI